MSNFFPYKTLFTELHQQAVDGFIKLQIETALSYQELLKSKSIANPLKIQASKTPPVIHPVKNTCCLSRPPEKNINTYKDDTVRDISVDCKLRGVYPYFVIDAVIKNNEMDVIKDVSLFCFEKKSLGSFDISKSIEKISLLVPFANHNIKFKVFGIGDEKKDARELISVILLVKNKSHSHINL